MTLVLVALGAFLAGQFSSVAIGRYWFVIGVQLGRDDHALDPGETTGSLEAVAEATHILGAPGMSTGRHARQRSQDPPVEAWPTEDPETTQRVPALSNPDFTRSTS